MTGAVLSKSPTGISGFDDVTLGGLPAGRPTLMCGAAGCGKTLFAMTFLVEGVLKYGEPGVLVSFEESAEDLAANVASLGYDVMSLIDQKKLAIDHIKIDPAGIEDTGEYDLEGLFVRLDYAIKSVNAKRVVLDTLEALFASFPDAVLLRAELRRLFDWLKERGVTAIVTAERGTGDPSQLTRHGIEEYVSDCVILLDNRVENQVTTRRLRIVKYRGSAHGTNEYPFLIDTTGISVLPITSAGLAHLTSSDVISTGIADLDSMLGVGGYFVGSSVLVSGLAGTGKTTFAAKFVEARCKLGERTLWFAFEESPEQIVRNMRSVGVDLAHYSGRVAQDRIGAAQFFRVGNAFGADGSRHRPVQAVRRGDRPDFVAARRGVGSARDAVAARRSPQIPRHYGSFYKSQQHRPGIQHKRPQHLVADGYLDFAIAY